MMKADIEKTYLDGSFKNYPHRRRLRDILSLIEREGLAAREKLTYADFGCNDGYITGLLAGVLQNAEVYGFDHCDKIETAKEKYPGFTFAHAELTKPLEAGPFDLVTCFETLEHVGDLSVALENLVRCTARGGILLITVPIEIGFRGIVKFFAKTLGFGYRLDELPGERLYRSYLIALLLRRDLSVFRDERFGWGTHFGFDYRVIDEHLREKGFPYRASNRITTRFYVVKP